LFILRQTFYVPALAIPLGSYKLEEELLENLRSHVFVGWTVGKYNKLSGIDLPLAKLYFENPVEQDPTNSDKQWFIIAQIASLNVY